MYRGGIILNSNNCHDETTGCNVIDRCLRPARDSIQQRPLERPLEEASWAVEENVLLGAMVAAYVCSCLAWTTPGVQLSETAHVLKISWVICAPGQGKMITSNSRNSHFVS